tara:strand:- start:1214 stop:2254 length:1041 start_codon:yes stop_codon:yes gene_type:complete
MPLRAILDDVPINAYELDAGAWGALKGSYKKSQLMMPCCPRKAIPKTSKLGVQYFAHARRGDCTSAPETEDHLLLKSLIAKTALLQGWQVTTEFAGTSPSGEPWIADVYCIKGDARIALEVQWSQQTLAEYQRRTRKYSESGVRCAWLFRLNGAKHHYSDDFLEDYELPYFGIRKDGDGYTVSRFDAAVPAFVSGLLTGQLSWHPKVNDQLAMRVSYVEVPCWRCQGQTSMASSLDVFTQTNTPLVSLSFTDPIAAKWIAENVPDILLRQHGIGPIRERHSKTARGAYLSNGCVHCDALQGNHFIPHHFELTEQLDSFWVAWRYNPDDIEIAGAWFFAGSSGRRYY